MRWLAVLLIVGCEEVPATTPADAAAADAYKMPPWGPDPTCAQGLPLVQAQCANSSAQTRRWRYFMGAGTHSMCVFTEQENVSLCSQGCTLAVSQYAQQGAAPDLLAFTGAAHVLCAETNEAKVGDACNSTGTRPCLPTRAALASDGTVESMTYLKCGSTSACEATTAPAVANYMQPCDAGVVAMYPTGNGYVTTGVSACLIADGAASGLSRFCIGDWQCPQGSLCDDQLMSLDGMKSAVCKPGPRGVLTPSMLSP